MRSTVLSIIFAVVTSVLPPVSTHAALIVSDWETPGDGHLTYDTRTGLDWLDWSVTQGWRRTDVASEIGLGGRFEGFRYATGDRSVTSEVMDLFLLSLGTHLDLWPDQHPRTPHGSAEELLIATIGERIGVCCNIGWLIGAQTATLSISIPGAFETVDVQNGFGTATFFLLEPLNDTGPLGINGLRGIGHALVRPHVATTPIPSSILLMASGLLGLIIFGKMKKRSAKN